MKIVDKEAFLTGSAGALEQIYDTLISLPELNIRDLNANRTALVIVDMVNGFVREGALHSSRIEQIILDISALSNICEELDIKKLAFADCHTEVSPEFDSYPIHCIKDTSENDIVDELKQLGNYFLINKNSTNGFLEEEFQNWLNYNKHINSFIITGDCTDICIQQLATTLKTWFNMQNQRARIIVPIDAVETFDLGMHSADLVNVMALYNMMINGVEIVKKIVY